MNFPAGVIEGFFGKSWSWPARIACVDFLVRWNYSFYIYAPKSDAFLRRRWREPLPRQSLERLRELSAHCGEQKIDFGVGLTPFEAHLDYESTARAALRAKVLQLNTTGAAILCVLFDDMQGGIRDLAERQSRIVGDICSWSNARQIIVCPTYYSHDPILRQLFGASPEAYLSELGRLMDRAIRFFWTGERVISPGYPAEHLVQVTAEMGREPFLWDNRLANDSRTRCPFLFLDPAFEDEPQLSGRIAGFAINPMNLPTASLIALAAYSQILQSTPDRRTLEEICASLCGPALASQLGRDLKTFQHAGLAKIDADQHAALLRTYSRFGDNPCAAEIAAWLTGDYAFDPACLTA